MILNMDLALNFIFAHWINSIFCLILCFFDGFFEYCVRHLLNTFSVQENAINHGKAITHEPGLEEMQ